jgi:hypothetical protein
MIDRCGKRIKQGDTVMIPVVNDELADITETTVLSVNGNTHTVRTDLGSYPYYKCIKLC